VDALIARATEAAGKGLPPAPIVNKIREGLAKGHDTPRIDAVLVQIAGQLESADRVVSELFPSSVPAGRERSVVLLAEAFAGGVTPDEVREIGRQSRGGPSPAAIEAVAAAAKALASIKDAQLPVVEGTAIVVEALRRGYRPFEVADLGREIRRREAGYRAEPARLRALRDAIARGDRPEQLFRDSRVERDSQVERPAATRPDTPQRPERPAQPERPQRPEVPERPGARQQ
jgi:hypothetical protein